MLPSSLLSRRPFLRPLFSLGASSFSRTTATMAAARKTAVVLRDDREIPYASKEELLAASKGMYTTARTIDKTFVMEFDAHLTRIIQSCTTMWANAATASSSSTTAAAPAALPPPEVQDLIRDPAALRPHVLTAFRTALGTFTQHFPDMDCERRITLLLDWLPPNHASGNTTTTTTDTVPAAAASSSASSLPPRGFSITTYTEPLPNPPSAPVEIKIGNAPPLRHGKVAKDAQWTRDRQVLEAQMGSANEVVMVDGEGNLMEGTQSNVYVVMDGTVYWPEREDILEGTIRKVVKRVCESHHIPFVASPAIPLHSITKWQGVFISSTSRLVLPVSLCTLLPDVHTPAVASSSSSPTSFTIPPCPLVATLADLVRGDLKTGSVDVS